VFESRRAAADFAVAVHLVLWLGFVCIQQLICDICLSRDGIALHIEEVEPVDGVLSTYGFVQQITAFIVEEPTRTPTTGKLGKGSRIFIERLVIIDQLYVRSENWMLAGDTMLA